MCIRDSFLSAQKYHPYGKEVNKKRWVLIWHDEFYNGQLFNDNWLVQNTSPNHILSSRWTENVMLKREKFF